jgi:TRAP-type C4-dicarboxylate transport system permease small subunit
VTADEPAKSPKPDDFDEEDHRSRSGLDLLIFRIESVISVLLLGGLIVAGLMPIIFRGNQQVNTGWVGPFTHHAVLWIALFGAAVASRDQKHITVDAIGQILPPHRRRLLHVGTDLLSAIVCGFVTFLSTSFVRQEWASAASPEFWGIPERILQLALPLGFAMITIRFVGSAWRNFAAFRAGPEADPDESEQQTEASS